MTPTLTPIAQVAQALREMSDDDLAALARHAGRELARAGDGIGPYSAARVVLDALRAGGEGQ